MDSSGVMRTRLDTPPWYYHPEYKFNVGDREYRHNFRRYRPEYDPHFISLDDRALREYYGWDKPSWVDIRGHGIVRRPVRTKRPDWNVSPRSEDIYRPYDASWKGRYKDENYDFINPRGNPKENSRKRNVLHVGNEYHPRIKEKHEDSPNVTNDYYIETASVPKVQNPEQKKGKVSKKKPPSNPHMDDANTRTIHRQTGNNSNNLFDPNEKLIVRHKNVISSVGPKVDAFNEAYVPLGGDKYYPTYDVKWRSKPKIDSRWDFKNENIKNSPRVNNSLPEIGRAENDHKYRSDERINKYRDFDLKTNYEDSKFVYKRPWNSSRFARSLAYTKPSEVKHSRGNRTS